MFSKFVHVVASLTTLFLLKSMKQMHTPQCTMEFSGCVHLSASVSNAAMNVGVYVCVESRFSPEEGLPDQGEPVGGLLHCFPRRLHRFHSRQRAPISPPPRQPALFRFPDNRYASGWEGYLPWLGFVFANDW